MSSRPGDYVSCLVTQGEKLRWEYRETAQLTKLYTEVIAKRRGAIRTAAYECQVLESEPPTAIIFVRTIRYSTFEGSHFRRTMDDVYDAPQYYGPDGSADTTTIFKFINGSPSMLSSHDLPPEIIAMISK